MSRIGTRPYRLAILLALLAGVSLLFPESQEPVPPKLLIPGLLLVSVTVIAVRYLLARILKRLERPQER